MCEKGFQTRPAAPLPVCEEGVQRGGWDRDGGEGLHGDGGESLHSLSLERSLPTRSRMWLDMSGWGVTGGSGWGDGVQRPLLQLLGSFEPETPLSHIPMHETLTYYLIVSSDTGYWIVL